MGAATHERRWDSRTHQMIDYLREVGCISVLVCGHAAERCDLERVCVAAILIGQRGCYSTFKYLVGKYTINHLV